MTAAEVERLVLAEVGEQWDRATSHGLDLRTSIVRPPRLETYTARTPDGEHAYEVWLVAEEVRDGAQGYQIFYDPEEQLFGLGTIDREGKRHYLGLYGSLWDALEGM